MTIIESLAENGDASNISFDEFVDLMLNIEVCAKGRMPVTFRILADFEHHRGHSWTETTSLTWPPHLPLSPKVKRSISKQKTLSISSLEKLIMVLT